MLPPYFLERAVDEGLQKRDTGALLQWTAAILVIGAAIAWLGILRHRAMTLVRVDASNRTIQVLVRQVARLGAVLPQRVSTGELAQLQTGDTVRIAVTLTIAGPGVGSVLAYAITAVLLSTISGVLAAVVLLGVPLLAIAVGPLLGKLHGAEGDYRDRQAQLTARIGDIVSGLGVLSGLGGKAVFNKRFRDQSQELVTDAYRVAGFTSWIQGIGACLPVVFLAAVTWISARMAADGSITIGGMVAVYGYVAALLIPVSFFIEGADDLPRGLVAARRVIGILSLAPAATHGGDRPAPDGPAVLRDPHSGLELAPGEMSALVSARLNEARAVVDRIARFTESDATWGDERLSAIDLAEVRRRIVPADNDAHLFSGTIRSAVQALPGQRPEEVAAAVHTAAADDILDLAPGGLEARLDDQARNYSGGQAQRLRLTRALLADPEVLLLVEPTSALDAHTEAVVAERLCAARQGATTLVVSTSPLMLNRAAYVSYLVDGKVVATGRHTELLASHPGYRALTMRGAEDGETSSPDELLETGADR
ncbi:ABC transporter transmembrane domain-containing protein [Streptomyces cyaneofuscatus]|uniref:ABC transporter transmembrane domain-containing protein n=1 Tax=Streptomyces cyaneofuscatus TaxID=66883 RepID=UPI0037B89B0F